MTTTAKKAVAAKKAVTPKKKKKAPRVEPDTSNIKDVPPVNTHEALNAQNDHEGYEKPKTEVVDVEFINTAHLDPQRKLPGGVYLDEVEAEKAEVARAKAEDREPDLENPGSYAGIVLVRKDVVEAQIAVPVNIDVPTVTLPTTVVKE